MKKKSIVWNIDEDLTNCSPIIRKIIFNVKIKNRKNFCDWIEQISTKNFQKLDWWLAIPSSRNPYLSDLYNKFCILETINILVKKKYSLEIKTFSKNFYDIILKWKSNKKNCPIKLDLKFKKSHQNFNFILKGIIFYSFIFFYIKIFIKKKKIERNSQNILVETFFIYNQKNKENFNSNIFKFHKAKYMYLVPSFLIQKNLILLMKTINQANKTKCIFKEHYLTLFDFISGCMHFLRKKKFVSNHIKFNQWDLSSIVNEEIKSNKNFYPALLGNLNFKFFKRLKENNIQIKKIISLFENQASGRGWCLGSRTYFPKVENLGYQGFMNFSQFLNHIPCQYEENAKILPTKIAVIDKSFIKDKKEFFKKLKVICAPALNINFKDKKVSKIKSNEVILLLNGIKEIDQKLIDWSINFLKDNLDDKVKLIIKFHPILPRKSFNFPDISNLKSKIIFSNDDINLLLNRAKLIVSTGPTSAIFEALLKKCFLIIPVFDLCDKLNIENCRISKNNYNLVYNYTEFCSKLKNLLIFKKKIKLKSVNKKFSFIKPNKQSMRIFIN